MPQAPGMHRGASIEVSRRGFNRSLVTLPCALAGCVTEDAQPTTDRPWHHTASDFATRRAAPCAAANFADWTSFYLRRFGGAEKPEPPTGHVLPPDAVAAGEAGQDDPRRIRLTRASRVRRGREKACIRQHRRFSPGARRTPDWPARATGRGAARPRAPRRPRRPPSTKPRDRPRGRSGMRLACRRGSPARRA